MRFYVYILFSIARDAYLIGHTGDDLKTRVREHNTNHDEHTGYIGEWMLMYFERFNTYEAAIQREQQIKKWKGRRHIEKLISLEHPGL